MKQRRIHFEGCRKLALIAFEVFEENPKHRTLQDELPWRFWEALGTWEIDLGPEQEFKDVNALAAFLRSIVSEEEFMLFRVALLDPEKTLEEQLTRLVCSSSLHRNLPRDATPLGGIIEQRSIETWYQPIFQSKGLKLWGYECLMRARLSDGALVFPDKLLAWADEEGLAPLLDRVCREVHITNAAREATVPGDCMFLINFLPTVIYKPELCLNTTFKAAQESGMSPDRVIFEVVETHAVPNREHLRAILDQYRDKGFRVALDDMGSGYSGLLMLADLEPDIIKIDRGLIEQCVDSEIHRTICTMLIDLGRCEGKLVLAEGVETPEQYECMMELGVDLFQGYLFGRPNPEPALYSQWKPEPRSLASHDFGPQSYAGSSMI